MEKTVNVELNHAELIHLQNDLISYIWKIKERVFGDAWNFGRNITEVEKLTPEQEEELRSSGYYSRLALLNKLDEIEKANFSTCECCGE